MANTVAGDVRQLVAEAAGMDAADLKDSDTLTDDLQLDSMDLINLAVEVESFLDVEVPDSSVRASMTLAELIAEVEKLKGVSA